MAASAEDALVEYLTEVTWLSANAAGGVMGNYVCYSLRPAFEPKLGLNGHFLK